MIVPVPIGPETGPIKRENRNSTKISNCWIRTTDVPKNVIMIESGSFQSHEIGRSCIKVDGPSFRILHIKVIGPKHSMVQNTRNVLSSDRKLSNPSNFRTVYFRKTVQFGSWTTLISFWKLAKAIWLTNWTNYKFSKEAKVKKLYVRSKNTMSHSLWLFEFLLLRDDKVYDAWIWQTYES